MKRTRLYAIPLLFGAIGLVGQAFGQGDCQNTSQYPGNAITPNPNGTVTVISTCNFQSEYSAIAGMVTGGNYQFVADGTTYITLRTGAFDGPVLAQGTTPLDVTAATNDTIYAHWNVNDLCATASTCINTSVQRILNCELPEVAVSYTEDCTAGTFTIVLDITSTGDGATVDVIYDDAGNVQTMAGVGTGIITLGPFTNGSLPLVMVQHESDPDCNINLGGLAPFTECAIDIVCGDPSITQNYCYADNDDVNWTYTGNGGGSMVLTFQSGTIEGSFNDRLSIYDGFDATGPVLFDHTATGTFDLTGLSVVSTTGSIHMALLASAFTSCATGSFGIEEWNWTVVCLNCEIPQATATVTDDCPGNAFNIAVDVVSTGDATTVDLEYIVNGGAPQTSAGVGTGITNLGPFTVGDNVSLSVNHDNDANCNLDLGVFTDLNSCPLIIACGEPEVVETYCYVGSDSQFWFYQSSGAGTMRLRFNQGTIESNTYDDLIIYDGIDNTAPVLFMHGNLTSNLGPVGSAVLSPNSPYYGVEVYATGNSLYMEMSSDPSVQCNGSTTYDSWEWEVVCLDCTIPVVSFSAADDCVNSQFSVPVVVTSTGDGGTVNINYTVNGGAVQTVTGVGVGTESIGPFNFSDTVNVIVAHGTNSLCDIELGDITDTGTCPVLIDCGSELGEQLCYANNTDSRYYYDGTGTLPLAIFFDSGTVFAGDLVNIYDGGDITAPLLYSGNNGSNMTGFFVNSSNPDNRLTLQIIANGFTDCATAGIQDPPTWRVFCLDCAPPIVSFDLVQDCINFQYVMEVTVTTMGTDPSIDVTNTGGAPTVTITAPGTYTVGPFVSGNPVEVVLVNELNDLCNVSSGVRVNPVCPLPVCGSTVLNETYCYVTSDSMAWAYELPTAGTLRLTFLRGTIESNSWDNLIIYDGTDNTAPILFMHGNTTSNLGPDGSGVLNTTAPYETVDVTATGSNLYMEMSSDFSGDCSSSTTYDPWEWQVYCEGCVPPGVSYNLLTDCFSRSFTTEVIVTTTPPAEGLQITNTITDEISTVNSSAVYNFGPYGQNTDAVFEIVSLDEPGCVYRSDTLSVPSSDCIIVSCGFDQYNYCLGNDEDRWYTFKSEQNVQTTITFISGQLLPGDRIVFYNGPDENSAVLYQGTNGGSFTGFALNSQNAANTITMRIQSDGSGSCGDGAAGATELWWHVGCGAVGIEETASTGFTMFPNPTNGSLTINIGASV